MENKTAEEIAETYTNNEQEMNWLLSDINKFAEQKAVDFYKEMVVNKMRNNYQSLGDMYFKDGQYYTIRELYTQYLTDKNK